MVSKKTLVILIGATTVAVISAMFVLGIFRSGFDKRLEEVSRIKFILPVEVTIESHLDWAERECRKINSDIASGAVYTSSPEQWGHSGALAPSWSWFKDELFYAIANGEFVGDYIYYNKASRTLWFSTLKQRTFPEVTTGFTAYYWTTHYITIK